MAGASGGFHEADSKLTDRTRDLHRALVSLQEELEAIDWYQQRVDAATDPELAKILAHNRDEEKEHAAMALEWLRRRDAKLDAHLRRFLFSTEPIARAEQPDQPEPTAGGSGDLGLRGLREPAR